MFESARFLLFLLFGWIACSESCETDLQEIRIDPREINLTEIHVRRNLHGDFSVVLGDIQSRFVQLKVIKSAASKQQLAEILLKTIQHKRHSHTTFILQLDVASRSSSGLLKSILVGLLSVAALSCFSLLLCCCIRQRLDLGDGSAATRQSHRTCAENRILESSPHDAAGESLGRQQVQRCSGDADSAVFSGSSLPPLPPPCCPLQPSADDRKVLGAEGYVPAAAPPSSRVVVTPGRASESGRVALSRGVLLVHGLLAVATLCYAACEQSVAVQIILPPSLKLGAIRLFTRSGDPSGISGDAEGQLRVPVKNYVLDDIPLTGRAPCDAFRTCVFAYHQDLAVCEPASQQCVCQKGYQLNALGKCDDIDECVELSPCPSQSQCTNLVGSFHCRCAAGHYSSEEGCSDCQKCVGATYESHSCQSNVNRRCLHVAQPLLIGHGETFPQYYKASSRTALRRNSNKRKLKVESSENVFHEDIDRTRPSFYKVYVQDVQQSSDFLWNRATSSLKINVGVKKITLLPEYGTVEHESDREFYANPTQFLSIRQKYEKIIDNYCTHPIPDEYQLALEIHDDRITAARSVICNDNDRDVPSCPPDHNNGDSYLDRSINKPCEKLGTFPAKMDQLANSFVCTRPNALLLRIFRLRATPEQPISFPSTGCRSATHRCQECLRNRGHSRCVFSDLFDQQCCMINCYVLRDCKVASKPECKEAEVSCASGSTYRYTLSPIYKNLTGEFQCHIRRKQQEVLYEMSYSIKVPAPRGQPEYISEVRELRVSARDLPFRTRGSIRADFIDVAHSSGTSFDEELILRGRLHSGPKNRTTYSVFPLRDSADFGAWHGKVHNMSNKFFSTSVQFKRPFGYSTRTWTAKQGCDKDVTRFQAGYKLYREHRGIDVNLGIRKLQDKRHFEYSLFEKNNTPVIEFKVAEGTSVLSHFFRDEGTPRLLTDASLRAAMTPIGPKGKVIKVTLKGTVTECPAYVGVVINDRVAMERLFNYDLMIFCPRNFSIEFSLPNRGDLVERTLEMVLNDGKKAFTIYLTHMKMHAIVANRPVDLSQVQLRPRSHWVLSLSLILLCALSVSLAALVYVFLEITKRKSGTRRIKFGRPIPPPPPLSSRDSCSRSSRRRVSETQYAFVVIYVLGRIIYSLVFTFTVLLSALLMLIQADSELLESFQQLQTAQSLDNQSTRLSRDGASELLRQARHSSDMQAACCDYIEQLFETLRDQAENSSRALHGQQSSLSQQLETLFAHNLKLYEEKRLRFEHEFRRRIDASSKVPLRGYRKYLDRAFGVRWLQFAQKMFNASRYKSAASTYSSTQLSAEHVNFGAFLPLEEVEQVQLWKSNFFEKYFASKPNLPELRFPRVVWSLSFCDDGANSQFTFNRSRTPDHRLASFRYFHTVPSDESLSIPAVSPSSSSSSAFVESTSPSELSRNTALRLERFLQTSSFEYIRIVFVALDVLIILFRCTRTFTSVRRLTRGFVERRVLHLQATRSPALEARLLAEAPNSRSTDDLSSQETNQRPMLRRDVAAADGALNDVDNCTTTRRNDAAAAAAVLQVKRATSTDGGWKNNVFRAVSSPAVPWLCVLTATLLGLLALSRLARVLLSVDVVRSSGAHRLLDSVGAASQLNQTNAYLAQQAHYLNNVSLPIYQTQMTSELLGLESLLQFFNSEQRRAFQNYGDQLCALRRRVLGTPVCEPLQPPPPLQLPLLPCNFMPIQPLAYAASASATTSLLDSLDEFLWHLRGSVSRFVCAALFAVAGVVLVHVIGLLTFHYMRTRRVFPVKPTLVTPFPLAGFPYRQNGDHEMEVYNGRHQLGSLLSSFRYSETKV